jgi:two-component system, sensor histidine kinase LadS
MKKIPIYATLLALSLCGLSLFGSALAAEKALDASRIGDKSVPLTEFFAVLEDTDRTLTLADVLTPEVSAGFIGGHPPSPPLAYGTATTPHWFRFRIDNPTSQPLERFIEVEFPRISDIQLHTPKPDGSYELQHTGAAQPFSTRPYANRHFVFPVTLPADSQQTFFLRLQSNTDLLAPVQVWSPKAFSEHVRRDYMIHAWYFGIATAIGLFNLLLFIALRERIYLIYVLFVATSIVTFATYFGMAHEFLWPGAALWAEKAMSITAVVQLTIFTWFTRHMLDTRVTAPGFDRGLLLMSGVLLVLLLGDLASIPGAFIIGQVFILLIHILIFSMAFYCVLKRERRAYFFIIAFGFYLIGVITYTLASMGLIGHNQLTARAGQVGSALEMLLLAFALADRFNLARREKLVAQAEALRIKQELLDSVRASERLLEARVSERTEELNAAMAKLQELSVTDELTGIANRRHFDSALRAEWSRAERAGSSLSLALIDVDRFKKFNDFYGHLQGDDCLRLVAQVLARNASRPGELAARYGGEEFALILPNTSGSDAVLLAERMRTAIVACNIAHAGSELGYLTISIGVACVTPCVDASPETLTHAADEALYMAKNAGRNQTVLINSADT